MAIKLIVGLGNPDKKYAMTRHNLGYRVIDELKKNPPGGAKLLKPLGYMNSSGVSVAHEVARNGIQPEEILVVCDDFSIALGTRRIRRGGSSGGHNGLDSIIQSLGTQEIARLRLGIGPVPEGQDPAQFVLQDFRPAERNVAEASVALGAMVVHFILKDGIEKAMNAFNAKAA